MAKIAVAVPINVAGPAEVKISTDAYGTLETLGYTRDGVRLSFRMLDEPIPADSRGGTGGGRRDTAFLDEECDIRLDLTRYNPSVAAKVFQRVNSGGQDGRAPRAGTLLIASNAYFRLLILTAVSPYNFPRVLFRSPLEINRGTRYSTLLAKGTAYRDDTSSRTLWNRTDS